MNHVARGFTALALASFVVAVAQGCGSAAALTCAPAYTKVCLSDDATCTCAPECHTILDCDGYQLCGVNESCHPCGGGTGGACVCSTSLCVPASWIPGEQFAFVGPGGEPGSPLPPSGSIANGTAGPISPTGDGTEAGDTTEVDASNADGTSTLGCAPEAVIAESAPHAGCGSIFVGGGSPTCGGDGCCCETGETCDTSYTTSTFGCGFCYEASNPLYATLCGPVGSPGSPVGIEFCPANTICYRNPVATSSDSYGCCPAGQACTSICTGK